MLLSIKTTKNFNVFQEDEPGINPLIKVWLLDKVNKLLTKILGVSSYSLKFVGGQGWFPNLFSD